MVRPVASSLNEIPGETLSLWICLGALEMRMPLDLLMIVILAVLTVMSFAFVAGLERV